MVINSVRVGEVTFPHPGTEEKPAFFPLPPTPQDTLELQE